MNYRSYAQLAADVAAWGDKLPSDIDLIVGVPRSGMLVASMLSLNLDRPLQDLYSYCARHEPKGGVRTRDRYDTSGFRRVLVVDDSTFSGVALTESRALVASAGLNSATEFGVVYIAERKHASEIDHWHALVPWPRCFEWNVMHHNALTNTCMDIDGVLCRDPIDGENDDGESYAEFLSSVPARLIPAREVGWLVTSRLERYRPQTEAWLKANGIRYGELIMHPAATGAERLRAGDHAQRKALAYRRSGAWLFIESDHSQAVEIARRSGKAVYCTSTRDMVQPSARAALRGSLTPSPRALARKIRRRLPTVTKGGR